MSLKSSVNWYRKLVYGINPDNPNKTDFSRLLFKKLNVDSATIPRGEYIYMFRQYMQCLHYESWLEPHTDKSTGITTMRPKLPDIANGNTRIYSEEHKITAMDLAIKKNPGHVKSIKALAEKANLQVELSRDY